MAKKILNHINTYADMTAYNADMEKDYPNVSYISGENLVLFESYAPVPVDYSTSFTDDSLTMWFTYDGADFICKDNTVFDNIGSVLPEGFPLDGEFFTGKLSIYKDGNGEALYDSPLTEVSMNKVGDSTYIRMVVNKEYKDTLGLVVVDDCYHLREFGGFRAVFSAISTEISEGDNIRIEITDIYLDRGMWYPTMSESEPIVTLRFYGTEVAGLGTVRFGYDKGEYTFKWTFNDLPEYQTGDDEYTIPIASSLSVHQVYLYKGGSWQPNPYYQPFVNLFTSGSALVYNYN